MTWIVFRVPFSTGAFEKIELDAQITQFLDGRLRSHECRKASRERNGGEMVYKVMPFCAPRRCGHANGYDGGNASS